MLSLKTTQRKISKQVFLQQERTYSKNGFGPEKSSTFYLPLMFTKKTTTKVINGTYTGFFRPESGKLS
jgi:hypothetical protein